MQQCLELIGEIIALHPFPKDHLQFSFPFNVPASCIKASDIRHGDGSISIDVIRNRPGAFVDSYINNVNMSGLSFIIEPGASVKETAKQTIAGVYYETKISAQTYDDVSAVRSFVAALSAFDYYDLVIVDSFYRAYLLRGVEPSTSVSMSANLPVSSPQGIEFTVVSCNGVLPIIFQDDLAV